MDKDIRVLVFGDSIAYGAWDTEAGWVERLKRDAHSQTIRSNGHNQFQVVNLGVGGDGSSKILKRMPSEIEARRSVSWEFAFVITFGTNDERNTDGRVETEIKQFEKNIRGIINIAKLNSNKILFVGVPPLGKSVVKFKNQEYSDERIKVYDICMEKIVKKANLPFVWLRNVFETYDLEDLYTNDYLHPNSMGHKLIYETVKPELEKLLHTT